jgi:hypothetical protein
MNRRNTVSVTPAMGASTVAGATSTEPMRTSAGTRASAGIACSMGLSQSFFTVKPLPAMNSVERGSTLDHPIKVLRLQLGNSATSYTNGLPRDSGSQPAAIASRMEMRRTRLDLIDRRPYLHLLDCAGQVQTERRGCDSGFDVWCEVHRPNRMDVAPSQRGPPPAPAPARRSTTRRDKPLGVAVCGLDNPATHSSLCRSLAVSESGSFHHPSIFSFLPDSSAHAAKRSACNTISWISVLPGVSEP